MKDDERRALAKIAENDKDEDTANSAMRQLRKVNSTYHWCPDWDFMVICNEDREHECCNCSFGRIEKLK